MKTLVLVDYGFCTLCCFILYSGDRLEKLIRLLAVQGASFEVLRSVASLQRTLAAIAIAGAALCLLRISSCYRERRCSGWHVVLLSLVSCYIIIRGLLQH
jgi:hypothetical protein